MLRDVATPRTRRVRWGLGATQPAALAEDVTRAMLSAAYGSTVTVMTNSGVARSAQHSTAEPAGYCH